MDVSSMTYLRMLMAPRSEVFTADLLPDDVMVVRDPLDGTVSLHVILTNDPVQELHNGRRVCWARLVDLSDDYSREGKALRERGYTCAREFPHTFYPPAEAIVEIIGRDVRR